MTRSCYFADSLWPICYKNEQYAEIQFRIFQSKIVTIIYKYHCKLETIYTVHWLKYCFMKYEYIFSIIFTLERTRVSQFMHNIDF